LAEGAAYRLTVFRLRNEAALDILVDHGREQVVFWPISRRAQEASRGTLDAYPRKWGGYAVPRRDWRPIYERLHHGPCPIIGTVTPFGLVLDTP
jgi:hypothetical protein